MRTFSRLGMLLSLAWLLGPAPAFAIDAADDISEPLRQLGAIDSADQPSSAAAAWKQVAEADVRQLPRVLAAIDTEHPLAANWLHRRPMPWSNEPSQKVSHSPSTNSNNSSMKLSTVPCATTGF